MSAPTTLLQAIQQKVRKLTRSPSQNLLSDSDLNYYINTFVLYDFPEHLRTFLDRTTYTFYCNPYQDTYETGTILFNNQMVDPFAGAINNPLYDFQNRFITIHPPIYIAGFESFFTESREQFYKIYPLTNSIAFTGKTGDGIQSTYSGFITNLNTQSTSPAALSINQPSNVLLQGNVTLDTVDANNNGLTLVDVPVVNSATGYKTTMGNLYDPSNLPNTIPTTVNPNNFVNYVTGQFTATFTGIPAQTAQINSQTIPNVVGLPQGLLYYNNKFTLRPVPDQPYRVLIEAYQRPIALMDVVNPTPELQELWQYIAYGTAKKVFEDKMDTESVQNILPEFKQQEVMCLRRTLVQQSNKRSATIYTENVAGAYGPGYWSGGGSF